MIVEGGDKGHFMVAAFLPPEHLRGLKNEEKKKLLVQFGPQERRRLPLSSVVPKVVSPKEAVERFDLRDAEKKVVTTPRAVAMAPLKKLPQGLDPSSVNRSVYRAEVEVGSRPAVSLVPVVGEWLGRKAADGRY